MADGSVTIGVVLDTSSLAASVTNLEMQMSSLGQRISTSLSSSLMSAGIAESLGASLAGVTAMVASTAENITVSMRNAALASIAAFSNAGWQSAGSAAAGGIAAGVTSGSAQVTSAVQNVSNSARSAFSASGWSSIGHQIMSGVASGILAAGNEVIAAIRKVSAEANAAVKSYYQIQSPSALMRDEVGVMISRGIAEGILSGSSYVSGAMTSVYSAREGIGDGQSAVMGRQGSVTQNIYLRDDDASPYRTARRIRRESEAIFRL